MYEDLKILETDYKNKYLIKHRENNMYVGFIAKEIIELLKKNTTDNEINTMLSTKYQTDIKIENIVEIKNKINRFISKEQPVKSFYKLFKILNPSKVLIPKRFYAIFNNAPFYITFLFFVIINIVVFAFRDNVKLSQNENIALFFLLFVILIIHEIGHSISSKKFEIDITEIGFGIYYILPVLYVNLNEIWKLDRKKRIIINFSGIYFQLIVGVFIFIFSLILKDYQNLLINLFHLNLLIVFLNLNPFFKFDGYWIVSDMLNEKNLEKSSNTALKQIFRFQKVNFKKTIVIYSILRLVFIIWILLKLFKYFYESLKSILTNQSFEWTNYLPVLILLFFLYKTMNPLFNKKFKKV